MIFEKELKPLIECILILLFSTLIGSNQKYPKPESEKDKDPRNQDPEEGYKSEEGLERITKNTSDSIIY